MDIFSSPLPTQPTGRWELSDDPHEFLFAKWVMQAHKHGLWFDFHLPLCTRRQKDVAEELMQFLTLEGKATSVAGLSTPELKSAGDKWRAFSVMQKAIRRGHKEMAWRATYALLVSGHGSGMWRRLMVTALEDIGMADPYLCAMVGTAVGSKKLRDVVGEPRLLWFLIQAMCDAPKSRDLCDVVVWMFLKTSRIDGLFKHVAHYGPDDLVAHASDGSLDFEHRLACHWRMSGPKWPVSPKHGNPDPGVKGLAQMLYKELSLPPLFRYVAQTGFATTGEALHLPIPFVWQLMTASDFAKTGPDPYENGDEELVGKVYAASFDKHTWQGKGALRSFLRESSPIRTYLEKHCTGDPMAALERAVFYTEGALLRPRLQYEQSDALFWQILADKMHANGFAKLSVGHDFYMLVQSQLWQLNKFRSKG